MRAAIVAAIGLVVVWLVVAGTLVIAGRGSAAREVATFLPNLIALFRGLARDRRVDRSSKVLLFVGLAWLISPIDLIPEFVPIAGPLDDAIVAALIVRRVVRRAGAEIVREHWRGSEESLRVILRLAGLP